MQLIVCILMDLVLKIWRTSILRQLKKKYVRKDDPDFKFLQAEVMVKTFVPIKYIINIDDFSSGNQSTIADDLPF